MLSGFTSLIPFALSIHLTYATEFMNTPRCGDVSAFFISQNYSDDDGILNLTFIFQFFFNLPCSSKCWCIVDDDDGTGVCPTNTTGITDGFSSTDELYATFQLTNEPDFLKLQSESGGACYPFKDSVVSPPYPEADGDQCVSAEDDDSMVCGYVYDSSSTTCKERKYEIQTFATADEATMTGAAIVHQGGKISL